MFEINPGLMVWTITIFILVASVMAKFAWKPIILALKNREESIRSSLEQAEKAREEAAELIKQNEKNIAKADEEYRRITQEAKAYAEKMKQEIVAEARQQAQHEVRLAKEEISRSMEASKKQLLGEVADIAIKAAENILDESLDEQKQRKLVDKFISQLPKN